MMMTVLSKVNSAEFSARVFTYGDHAIDQMISRKIDPEIIDRMIERSFEILDEECEMTEGELMIRSLKEKTSLVFLGVEYNPRLDCFDLVLKTAINKGRAIPSDKQGVVTRVYDLD